MTSRETPPPGWYPAPDVPGGRRWWGGEQCADYSLDEGRNDRWGFVPAPGAGAVLEGA
jgi:hypothetical protein